MIAVQGSSVNPSDVDMVEMGLCGNGCGDDLAGIVVACENCKTFKVGDYVWGLGDQTYADYAKASEDSLAHAPTSLKPSEAGSVPEAALTSLFSLKRTGSLPNETLPKGSPWKNTNNLTVVITAGAGGTGSVGIELAKAYGAKHVITSAHGEEQIAYLKELGATLVIDYKKHDIFNVLASDSVDIVYDNYGAEGTADKAMASLRPGGVYLMLPHGFCYASNSQKPPCLSARPKPGVRQLNYATSPDFARFAGQGLQELTDMFLAKSLKAHVNKTFYGWNQAALAFDLSQGKGQGGVSSHLGKIALAPNQTLYNYGS